MAMMSWWRHQPKTKGLQVSNSTPIKKNPPEGKTTAVVAVMRGDSKHGYHRHHHRNKHYKKKIVRVLLDSGSDGDLVFVNKDKPILLP